MTDHETTHDLTRTPPPLLRRARLAFFLVAVILPVVITAIAVVVLLTWLPALPPEVATHWGLNVPTASELRPRTSGSSSVSASGCPC